MEFQFLCPQGHLLQGDETMVGQQCKCPYCETEFLVPPPAGAAPAEQPGTGAASWPPSPPAAGTQEPGFDQFAAGQQQEAFPGWEEQADQGGFPGIRTGGAAADPNEVPAFGVAAAESASIVHVICPNKHVLETPRDMLGQDAMCPYCQAEFRLRFEDTEEYRRELEEQRERREQQIGRAWMNWAIAVAVVVVLGVITLIVVAVSS